MPAPSISYITIAELKSQTLLASLKALSDASLTILIQQAEDDIDSYVGRQKHHRLDANTTRRFPREGDEDLNGSPRIPYEVSRATLRQVEWLYKQWWPNSATDELPVERELESENFSPGGAYSYTVAEGGMDFSKATLSPRARAILDSGFRSKFAGIDVSSPVPGSTLSSRLPLI